MCFLQQEATFFWQRQMNLRVLYNVLSRDVVPNQNITTIQRDQKRWPIVSRKQSLVTKPKLVQILDSTDFKTASYKKDWKEIKKNTLKELKENIS